MSDYPKVFERPYKVMSGFESEWDGDIRWTFLKAFHLESDAEAYAERMSEDFEFVKIEKKENN